MDRRLLVPPSSRSAHEGTMRSLTILFALVAALVALLVAVATAWAGPGDFGGDPMESLAILDAPAGRTCAARSGVCLYPGARSTVAVESTSAQVASRKAAAPVV